MSEIAGLFFSYRKASSALRLLLTVTGKSFLKMKALVNVREHMHQPNRLRGMKDGFNQFPMALITGID